MADQNSRRAKRATNSTAARTGIAIGTMYAAAQSARPIPIAPAPKAVHVGIDILEADISHLESVVHTLVARLEPVTGGEPPTHDGTGTSEAIFRVPLAERLECLRCRLAGINGRLAVTLDRLEI